MNTEIRYIHQESVHNYIAPREVVPELIKILNPKSVIDIGCGTGTWLKIFQDLGVDEIIGIDGTYVDLSSLKIENKFFKAFDLEKMFAIDRKFDLAISLEVAEHLSKESSDVFVKTICDLSDTVVFSAAIKYQDGQNHINEQNPEYWIEKFNKNGFELFDVLRPIFWNNTKVDYWYRQNILLFTKDESLKNNLRNMPNFLGNCLVHPEGFQRKQSRIDNFISQAQKVSNGEKNFRFYLKVLLKSLKYRLTN